MFQNRQQRKESLLREVKKSDEKAEQNNRVGVQEAGKVSKA